MADRQADRRMEKVTYVGEWTIYKNIPRLGDNLLLK